MRHTLHRNSTRTVRHNLHRNNTRTPHGATHPALRAPLSERGCRGSGRDDGLFDIITYFDIVTYKDIITYKDIFTYKGIFTYKDIIIYQGNVLRSHPLSERGARMAGCVALSETHNHLVLLTQ